MSDAPRSLFVYYRVPVPLQDAARRAVDAIHAQLREAYPGLNARLMQRADTATDAQAHTWMEVYEHPSGISQACEQSLAALVKALPPDLIGPRHTEVFCPMAASPRGEPA
ncbi:DUF4936 family protein [Aquabacterium sp.]|uniref:DUF4936 family protein n=1 Tax=Aquabacterium sp. TaxID=1872578 RepID=UPI002E309C41|nr:DUF4936 family protein [Aquabacterium sp.]HEX5312341.1 DUF4936 family protein [Aquabacterium sp.]